MAARVPLAGLAPTTFLANTNRILGMGGGAGGLIGSAGLQRGSSSAAGGMGANDVVCSAFCNMGEGVGGKLLAAYAFYELLQMSKYELPYFLQVLQRTFQLQVSIYLQHGSEGSRHLMLVLVTTHTCAAPNEPVCGLILR